MMNHEESIACSIIERAIEDYKHLKSNNIAENKIRGKGRYSLCEIEKFFNGEWCSLLLESMNCSLTGRDILHKLQTQFD